MSSIWKLDIDLTLEKGANDVITETLAISETVAKTQRLDITLDDATDDQEVDLATLIGTAEEVHIVSDVEITVKLAADTNYGIVCEKLIISRGAVTKIYLSNDSGDTANVVINIGG